MNQKKARALDALRRAREKRAAREMLERNANRQQARRAEIEAMNQNEYERALERAKREMAALGMRYRVDDAVREREARRQQAMNDAWGNQRIARDWAQLQNAWGNQLLRPDNNDAINAMVAQVVEERARRALGDWDEYNDRPAARRDEDIPVESPEREAVVSAFTQRLFETMTRMGRYVPFETASEAVAIRTEGETRSLAKLARLRRVVAHPQRYGNLLQRREFTNEGVLYRIGRSAYADEFVFLLVRCPSTGEQHLLFVPPQMGTVREARAWTFHLDSNAFKPEIET